jgi:hypothetical protein
MLEVETSERWGEVRLCLAWKRLRVVMSTGASPLGGLVGGGDRWPTDTFGAELVVGKPVKGKRELTIGTGGRKEPAVGNSG